MPVQMKYLKPAFSVPYGKGEITFELPEGMRGHTALSHSLDPLKDVEGAIQTALRKPINTLPLHRLAKPGDKACIVFTDITRSSPDHLLIPALLHELEKAGVRRKDITLLCGVGMHRASTDEEKIIKLGEMIVNRYRVVDHEAQNPEALADLGTTKSGIPLSVNKIACEADVLIATGIVEPHQYAGYSGGRKTLAVGAAGEEMIAYTHGPLMVDHKGTRLGKTEGNMFHEAVTEAALRAGLRFIINVVQDERKRTVAVMAGEPMETFSQLVTCARRMYEVPVPFRFDAAVAGVGYPKDTNLYQASRAASYLFFAPISVIKDGGVIIIPAPTQEGVGDGEGERRFFNAMKSEKSMGALIEKLLRTGYPPGAQRAYVMAKVLKNTTVIIVGSETPKAVQELQMIPAPDMTAALRIVKKKFRRDHLDVLVVPHALQTLPIVERGAQ